jgi:hypothetical protein
MQFEACYQALYASQLHDHIKFVQLNLHSRPEIMFVPNIQVQMGHLLDTGNCEEHGPRVGTQKNLRSQEETFPKVLLVRHISI